jgi:Molecular chaperone
MADSIVRYLGIDFGTSTSVMSYMDYKEEENKLTPITPQPIIVTFGQSNPSVPTLIVEPGELGGKTNNEWLFGWEAENTAYYNHLKSEFKMDLLNPDKRDKTINLIERFFSYMLSIYNESCLIVNNVTIESTYVYVSYPVKWPSDLRKITIDAARKAVESTNIKNASIIGLDEPSAAIHYWLSTAKEMKEIEKNLAIGDKINIMLLDMGAGTTDVVILEYVIGENSGHKVLATYPSVDEKSFGGREVDEILMKYFTDFYKKHKVEIRYGKYDNIASDLKFRTDIRKWKETVLSRYLSEKKTLESEVYPAKLTSINDERGIDIGKFDRERLERILKDKEYLSQFPALVNGAIGAIKEFGLTGDDIDLVICTGGHSQWYFVEEMLKGKNIGGVVEKINLVKLKKERWRLCRTQRPQETVARGLSLQGMPINIKKRGANNVWLKIRCRNFEETVKIMDKGKLLPFSSTCTFDVGVSRAHCQDINLTIIPMVGSTLENSIPQPKINKKIEVKLIHKILDLLKIISGFPLDTSKEAVLSFRIESKFDPNDIWSAEGVISYNEAKLDSIFTV